MAAEIGIRFIVDPNGIVTPLKQAAAAADSLNSSVKGAASSIKDLGSFTNLMGQQMRQAAAAEKAVSSQLLELRAQVTAFGGGVKNTNTAALAFAQGLKNVKQEAASSTSIFSSFGNQVKSLGSSVISGFGSLVSGVNGAYGAIRKLAFILPGIGIAGIFGLIGEGLVSIFSDISKDADQAQEAVDKLAKNLVNVGAAGREAAAGESGNIAIVKDLAAAVLNTNLSYQERQKALNQLKNINKSYFGDLTLETAQYGKLTALVNDYATALVNEAITKKFVSEIADTAKAISDADDVATKAKTKYNQALEEQRRAQELVIAAQSKGAAEAQKAQGKNLIGVFGQGQDNSSGFNLRVVEALTQREKADKKVATAEKELQAVLSVSDRLQFQRSEAEDKLNKALLEGLKLRSLSSKGAFAPDKDNSDSELSKQIASINKQIDAIEELRRAGVATRADIAELFRLKISKIELGLPRSVFTDRQALALKNQLEDEATKALAADSIKIDVPKILVKGIDKIPVVLPENAIVVDTNKALKSAQDAGKGTAEVISKNFALGAKTVDVAAAIDQALTNNLQPAIESVAASIGDAFSGGGFASVLKAVAGSIGQFIQDFGKILVKGALEIIVLKKVAKAIVANPGAALIVGAAAIALGAFIKNSLGNVKQKGFREGGISDGPTSGYYALLHGKEVIAPYDKAAALLGGGNGGVTLMPSIDFSGDKFRIMLQNIDKKRGRI